MSDTKWLLKQGFETIETTKSGFSLLVYKLDKDVENPKFNDSVKSSECSEKERNNSLIIPIVVHLPNFT